MKTINVSPNPNALIISMRSLGYDIKMAIADIIDNSISAGATKIDVKFVWRGEKSIVFIKDNGWGMKEDDLVNNMRLGSVSPNEIRSLNDMGRFGLGLKAASFSQCKRLTVISKRKDSGQSVMSWDLDYVKNTNEWLLQILPMNEYEVYTGDLISSGTIVVWDILDKSLFKEFGTIDNPESKFDEIVESVYSHIGITFNEFVDKIEFRVNDFLVEMWDPFLSLNPKTQIKPSEYFDLNGSVVKITPYVLPHADYLSPEEIKNVNGDSGWQNLQGYYVYRNHRLIVKADWFVPKMEKKLSTKHARIKLEIDNSKDELWNIDLKKSVIVPPLSIMKDIRRIASFAREESEKIFRYKAKAITKTLTGKKEFVWETKVKDGKFSYHINRKHPYIRMIIGENESEDIRRLISIIETSMPLQEIVANHQDTEMNFKELPDIAETDMISMAMKVVVFLKAKGNNKQDIISIIKFVQPFSDHPEIIEEVEKYI